MNYPDRDKNSITLENQFLFSIHSHIVVHCLVQFFSGFVFCLLDDKSLQNMQTIVKFSSLRVGLKSFAMAFFPAFQFEIDT